MFDKLKYGLFIFLWNFSSINPLFSGISLFNKNPKIWVADICFKESGPSLSLKNELKKEVVDNGLIDFRSKGFDSICKKNLQAREPFSIGFSNKSDFSEVLGKVFKLQKNSSNAQFLVRLDVAKGCVEVSQDDCLQISSISYDKDLSKKLSGRAKTLLKILCWNSFASLGLFYAVQGALNVSPKIVKFLTCDHYTGWWTSRLLANFALQASKINPNLISILLAIIFTRPLVNAASREGCSNSLVFEQIKGGAQKEVSFTCAGTDGVCLLASSFFDVKDRVSLGFSYSLKRFGKSALSHVKPYVLYGAGLVLVHSLIAAYMVNKDNPVANAVRLFDENGIEGSVKVSEACSQIIEKNHPNEAYRNISSIKSTLRKQNPGAGEDVIEALFKDVVAKYTATAGRANAARDLFEELGRLDETVGNIRQSKYRGTNATPVACELKAPETFDEAVGFLKARLLKKVFKVSIDPVTRRPMIHPVTGEVEREEHFVSLVQDDTTLGSLKSKQLDGCRPIEQSPELRILLEQERAAIEVAFNLIESKHPLTTLCNTIFGQAPQSGVDRDFSSREEVARYLEGVALRFEGIDQSQPLSMVVKTLTARFHPDKHGFEHGSQEFEAAKAEFARLWKATEYLRGQNVVMEQAFRLFVQNPNEEHPEVIVVPAGQPGAGQSGASPSMKKKEVEERWNLREVKKTLVEIIFPKLGLSASFDRSNPNWSLISDRLNKRLGQCTIRFIFEQLSKLELSGPEKVEFDEIQCFSENKDFYNQPLQSFFND